MYEPRYPNTKPSGPGRDGYSSSMRQAVQPVADMVGKSAEACWRRYRNIANEQAKYAGERRPAGRGTSCASIVNICGYKLAPAVMNFYVVLAGVGFFAPRVMLPLADIFI